MPKAASRISAFPRKYAETLNYTLGAPRSFQVASDGKRIFFLRAKSSSSRALDLWCVELGSRQRHRTHYEFKLADIATLSRQGFAQNAEPAADKIRRERTREAANGITSYTIDMVGSKAAFAVGGDIYLAHVGTQPKIFTRSIGDATHATISPDGRFLAFVSQRELFVAKVSASGISKPKRVSPSATSTQFWGLPEFVAAEEMHRQAGFWWSPDSTALVFQGTDERLVTVLHLADVSDPSSPPPRVRYPYAGSENAELSLYIWSIDGGTRAITWDSKKFPYLVNVGWKGISPTLTVQNRPQTRVRVLSVNRKTGRISSEYEKADAKWVELIPGVPSWIGETSILDAPDAERRRLQVNGQHRSKAGLEVRKFVGTLRSGGLVYLASEDPRETHVWVSFANGKHIRLSKGEGVFDASIGGETVLIHGADMTTNPLVAEVVVMSGFEETLRIRLRSLSSKISNLPCPAFFSTSKRKINYAVLLPDGFTFDRKLPVLLDPYGGPWVQRCTKSVLSYTTSQWFADQGFVVIVGDGRGTPGRGRKWEKAILGDLMHIAVSDQMEVLDDAINRDLPIDSERVAVRGWSFGGYLAASMAMLHPERIHAAIAGAPVTDWRLYDTHYTERYLGDPGKHSERYDACSLVHSAHRMRRPLLLIHGINDDNVVVANTLRFSQALFEAGIEHNFLPLVGITHMAASSAKAVKHLLQVQLSFLKKALGLT